MLRCMYALKKVWVSYISKRYSQANSKCLKSFLAKQKLNYVIYLDGNNFYGYAMSKFLLTSEFKWTDPKNVDSTTVPKDAF